jgi:hypothetical protein
MRHHSFTPIILLILIACNIKPDINTTTENNKDEKLKTDKLKYTVYRFYPDSSMHSWSAGIINYLEVDNEGSCSIIRQESPYGIRKFFKAALSIDLRKQIDSVLFNHSYDTTYLYNSSKGYTYDGPEYILDY